MSFCRCCPGLLATMPGKCIMCHAVQAVYGMPGEKATRCATCKDEHMVDVYSKKCIVCKNVRASFGVLGGTATHCRAHATSDMKSVNLMCIVCKNVQPNYGFPGERPTHCGKCKIDGMGDVVNTMCVSCKIKRPSYGFPGGRASHCAPHAINGMIDLVSKMCCVCRKKNATYGYSDDPRTHCASCAISGMTDCSPKCHRCNTVRATKAKYKGYCCRCFIYEFPDHKLSRGYNVKEFETVKFVKELMAVHPHYSVTYNRKVGTSGRRPDVFIDCDGHVIVIEVDENQHETYDCTCENKRTMQISKDIGHRPLIFIRFNPDKYTGRCDDGSSRTVPTCFNYDGRQGLPVIRDHRKAAWEDRLRVLKDTIESHINLDDATISDLPLVKHVMLFYDDFHAQPESLYPAASRKRQRV